MGEARPFYGSPDLGGPGAPSASPQLRQGGTPALTPGSPCPPGPGRCPWPGSFSRPGPSEGGRAGVMTQIPQAWARGGGGLAP